MEFDTTATAVSEPAGGSGGVDAKAGWAVEESVGDAVSDCGGDERGVDCGCVSGSARRGCDESYWLRVADLVYT